MPDPNEMSPTDTPQVSPQLATAFDFDDEIVVVEISRSRHIEVDASRGFVEFFAEGAFSDDLGTAIKKFFDITKTGDPEAFLSLPRDDRALVDRALREYVCKISRVPLFVVDEEEARSDSNKIWVGRLGFQDLMTLFMATNAVEVAPIKERTGG